MWRLGISLGLCGLLLLSGSGSASTAKAFWQSLLVPGWGQYSAGNKTSATGFFLTELGLWTGYWALGEVASARRHHFKAYAGEHAGAQPQGKHVEYFDDLGFYQDINQHNRFALRDDGPEASLYPQTPDFFWEWDVDTSRRHYRSLRNESKTAERQAVFVTGLVIANHLIAAIHAARSLPQIESEASRRPHVELVIEPWRARIGMILTKSLN